MHRRRELPLRVPPRDYKRALNAIDAAFPRAEVDLPKEKGEQTATPDEEGLVINILPDGVIIVSGETLTFDQLTTMVRREVARENAARGDATGLRLLLRADQHADTRMLNSIVRMIRQEGVGAARFGTEVPR